MRYPGNDITTPTTWFTNMTLRRDGIMTTGLKYGDIGEFESFLKGLELSQVTIKPVGQVITLPKILMHPRILGRAGIVWGQKLEEI
jgi:hypothetical protein